MRYSFVKPLGLLAALLPLVPLVSAYDNCALYDATLEDVTWYRQEGMPLNTAFLVKTDEGVSKYSYARQDTYHGDIYSFAAVPSIDNVDYIRSSAEGGDSRQFKINFRDVNDNILYSYWIQRNVNCQAVSKVSADKVRTVTIQERCYKNCPEDW